jgi:hypothetical protein
MGIAGNARGGHLREHGARALLVLAVLAVVAIVGAGLVLAGVDRVEVVATLLFVPVFAAGLVVGRSAGLLTAAIAAVVYLALRAADVDDAGVASVGLLTLTRAVAYAVAAEVGVRAQPLVDRLSQGNEWDDSPLVARGRAFSRRERPGEDAFATRERTSVWVTTPHDDAYPGSDDDAYAAPAPAAYAGSAPSDPSAWSEPEPVAPALGARGSEWAAPLGSLGPEPAREPETPAHSPGSNGWPPDPPTMSPPPWSDPYGSPAVAGRGGDGWAPPAASPPPWSDPNGSPAVSDPRGTPAAQDLDSDRGQPGAWYDAVPTPPPAPAPPRPAARAPRSAPGPPIDP